MSIVRWTERAQSDLAAIQAFIQADSPHYAAVVVRRLLRAVDRLVEFPESGRAVTEFSDRSVREVIARPYRIVYRIVGPDEVHVITIHHGSRDALERI